MSSRRGPSYCSLCDIYFPANEVLVRHIQESKRHPWCNKCSRRFANKLMLHKHWKGSTHHYCTECSIDFLSPEGLQMHFNFSSAHGDNRNDSDDDSISGDKAMDNTEDWEDDFRSYLFPEDEFQAARLRGELTSYDPEQDEGYDTDDDYFGEDESTLTYHIRGNQIDGFPHTSVRPGNLKLSKKPYTCPLCLEIPQHCASTQCGHAFCASCLERSLELKNRCPVCKTAFTTGYGRVAIPPVAQGIIRKGVASICNSIQSLYISGNKPA